jgi:glycosyltransferase involved in cell wall biosynthesis
MEQRENSGIILWYLGSRGSGSLLLEKIKSLLIPEFSDILIFDKDYLERVLPYTKQIPFMKFLCLVPGIRHFFVKKIFSSHIDEKYEILLVIMSSSMDIDIHTSLPASIKLFRFIHESSKHKGDFWPTNRTIKKMLKSGKPLTLSSFVSENIHGQHGIVAASTIHPLLINDFRYRGTNLALQNKYLLVIGRQKKYQNSHKVISLWAKGIIGTSLPRDTVLVIAGKSNLLTYLRWKSTPRTIWIRHWLSDEEFLSLISNASVVLCLYSTASQSGVISACQSVGTPFVATDVGGIPEQASYGGGVIVTKDESGSWDRAIYQGFIGKVPSVNTEIDAIFLSRLVNELKR